MAAATGGEEMEETQSVENPAKPPNKLQQSTEKVGEVSTNGAGLCSSIAAARKEPIILRPAVLSPNTASRSSIPVFGSRNVNSPFTCTNFTSDSSPQKRPFTLKPSLFGHSLKTSTPDKDNAARRPIILRASQLESVSDSPVSSSTNHSTSSFILSPAKLNNPFNRAAFNNDESNGTSDTSTHCQTVNSSQESEKANLHNPSPEPSKVSFVPLASSGCSSQSQAPPGASATATTFVFGQNLHERVEVSQETLRSEAECSGTTATNSSNCDGEVSKTNGVRWSTDNMGFSSFIKTEQPDKQSEIANDERKRKSLSEAAREYEESRAVKRKYEEVTVTTGEEEEINILQINCKLFAFNKDKSNWVERGRGTLRLNDLSVDNRTQSRVVMRASGSFRVVLNTKIWAEMAVDRPSNKSVRLTAMDSSGEIKVFLVMAGVKEIDQLFTALEYRVNNQKLVASTSEKSIETNVS